LSCVQRDMQTPVADSKQKGDAIDNTSKTTINMHTAHTNTQ